MDSSRDLFRILGNPESACSLDTRSWDLLIRQARNADLLARLADQFHSAGVFEGLPGEIKPHLLAAQTIAKRHQTLVDFELRELISILSPCEGPLVVLKGAAYLAADLPTAKGRVFADIDLMLPKDQLPLAERLLRKRAWVPQATDSYDDRYYRTWMHELPAFRHLKRGTVLDLHHTILPETARLKPSADKLFAAAVPVEAYPGACVLSPKDMVIHSATHLFHDDEYRHGTRDLSDIDSLLRHFGDTAEFWESLVPRAEELELARPLGYALHFCEGLLGTPVPGDELRHVSAVGGLTHLSAGLTLRLLVRALQPDHPSCRSGLAPLILWLLYLRSHYLRMPIHLLVPHLLHKAIMTPLERRRLDKFKLDQPTIEGLFAPGPRKR